MHIPLRMKSLSAAALLAASLIMLSACGTDAVTGPAPAFTLALDSTTATVGTVASSGTVAVIVTRRGGYDGVVSLTVEGAPAGVTAAFSARSISRDVASSFLLLAAEGATPGTYTITVRGSGAGVSDHVATLELTVSSAMDGGYFLRAAGQDFNIPAGTSLMPSVHLDRINGFTGAVSLSLDVSPTGASGGLTASVGNPGTADAAALSIATSRSTPPGVYTLTITGSATGIATQTTVVTVTVIPALGSIGFQFCDAANLPVWFAVQDDDGEWTRVSGTRDFYSFDVRRRGGVAYIVPVTDELRPSIVYGYYTYIHYGTAADLRELAATQCRSPIAKRITGTVAGVSSSERATVGIGGVSRLFIRNSFFLANVPDGPRDLIAARSSYLMDYGVVLTPNRLIIRRGINPSNNGSVGVLDFGSAEAFAPVERKVTITGIGTARTFRSTGYATANGGTVNLSTEFDAAGGGTQAFHGVPKARQAPGDLHTLFIHAFDADGDWDQSYRTAQLSFTEAADKTVALGPSLLRPVITRVASAPTIRFRTQLPVQAEYDSVFNASIYQGTESEHGIVITATAGYRDGAKGWDVTVPDFSRVPGWLPQSALRTDLVTKTTVTASSTTRQAALEGFTIFGAGRSAPIDMTPAPLDTPAQAWPRQALPLLPQAHGVLRGVPPR